MDFPVIPGWGIMNKTTITILMQVFSCGAKRVIYLVLRFRNCNLEIVE